MFKKILFTSVLLTATSFAMANTAPYVGASLGVNASTASSGQSFRGMPLTVFGGYGGVIGQSFYLAGELDATLGTYSLNNNGLKSSYGYGVSILPGGMFSEYTLGYFRLGLLRTRFTTAKATKSGIEFGLGMQTSLTQNVDLRGEYDYRKYNTFSGISAPRADLFTLGLVYKID